MGDVVESWYGECGEYRIPKRFRGVRFRWDGYPDRRFKKGREMIAYFKRKDQETMRRWQNEIAAHKQRRNRAA